MKEREALFRVAVEYASDGIVAIDEQGTIILFNPAAERLFGCKAFEVIGQPVTVLVPEPHRQELGEYIRGQLRTGQGKTIGFARELTGLRKQGETFHLDIAVNEGGAEGQRVFVGVLRDGTERKKTEAELIRVREEAERANREMSAFLSRMRHDLRTPLNAIIGFAQLLEMKPLEAKQKEWVNHILKGGQHLLTLINKSAGSERSTSTDGGTSKLKILIVDDDPQMRAYIQAALESLPVEVLMAEDGMDAMTLIESVRPALLLTDYQMQIVDGLTLAHQIREHPDLKSIKIVLITGAATEAEVLQAVNHGLVDAALLKPVDVHDLQHVSRRLLNLLA